MKTKELILQRIDERLKKKPKRYAIMPGFLKLRDIEIMQNPTKTDAQ